MTPTHRPITSTETTHRRMLAIETSGAACSVALAGGPDIISSHTHYVPHVHDRLLATMVERMMGDHELTWDGVDAVAVSSGPGSFTGLRIGISLAKAICMSGRPKLVGVPTLPALAAEAATRHVSDDVSRIVVAYPSQRGQLYAQIFDRHGAEQTEAVLIASGDFHVLVNDGTFVCSTAALPEVSAVRFAVIPMRADYLVPLASRMLERGQVQDSDSFVPLYVQDFVPKTS